MHAKRNAPREQKEINIPQVLGYLQSTFSRAAGSRNVRVEKGMPIYDFQVEFCYLLDAIQNGPKYIVPKTISKANALIEQMGKQLAI